MPQVVLPFTQENKADAHDGDLFKCSLYRMLPPPLQETTQKNVHLLEYLHFVPLEQVGIPKFYPKLSRELRDLKQFNLIYPVKDSIFTHIYSNGEERPLYISIEPTLTQNLETIMAEVEKRLVDYVHEFGAVETEEDRKKVLLSCLDKICTTQNPRAQNMIRVTPQQLEGIKYLLIRDKTGMGILDPIIRDSYIEDISCSGMGHIFVEHKIFGSLKSAVNISTFDELDDFVLRLAERIGKPLSLRDPIMDAVLPDGSRINIVFGREVAKRGSNFTIRKFSDIPISIMDLIEFGTLDYHVAAYLSMILEEGMNLFVCGETASGKTTMLNAITTFISSTAKIVSIEDTPELQVPHKNWIREIARGAKKRDESNEVTMFELLQAALRQRPNVIIIGEIRGVEGYIAFQGMQTGHQVMATFHADSVQKLVQRLTGNPINIPKTYVDNLNLVLILSQVKLRNGKTGRRVLAVSEIVGYDPITSSFSFMEIFRWNAAEDRFEFPGNGNSYLLEQKIAVKKGLAGIEKRQIYAALERRAKILEKLHKEKGIKNFYELLQVLAQAQRQGIF